MTSDRPAPTEQIRRQFSLLLVAMMNGLVLYGAIALWWGPRINGGSPMIELSSSLVIGLLGVCLIGAMLGVVVGRSGREALHGTAIEIAEKVRARRIVGAAIAEGCGFFAVMLGILADAFPLALAPAAAAVLALFMLRPGHQEWRDLMRRARA